tara:strand:+ start:367 stop:1104 length:738 start_codon:yes stop_codon:yes gene_type:complete
MADQIEILATNIATVGSTGPVIGSNTWATFRDDDIGNHLDTSSDGQDLGVRQFITRGSAFVIIYRVFFEFDTSGISVAPSEATLKIYGRTNDAGDFFVVRSSHGTGAPSRADFDAITGWDISGGGAAQGDGSGTQEGNVTKYSSEVTSWSTSGYNDITLNATALFNMVDQDDFTICLIESVHDLRDISNTNTSYTGMYFAGSQSTVIKIDYTPGGYGNPVMGVASANIGKINGIATADISKVNGV